MKRTPIRRTIVIFLAAVLILSIIGISFASGDYYGEYNRLEEENDEMTSNYELQAVQEISNWSDLNNTRDHLAGNYTLMNNLNDTTDGYETYVNTTKGWDPIGNSSDPFEGTLDGNGFEISDLMIDRDESYVGLFGDISEMAEITDINLVDANVSSDGLMGTVGGIAGRNRGMINSASVIGDVNGYVDTGGLVGINLAEGEIENSYTTGNVTGNFSVGGLVGENEGTISNSYSTGNVSGEASIGGLVGGTGLLVGSTVINSYATGNVSGEDRVGGLVGRNYGTVETSYATGNVSGDNEIGGLVGRNGPFESLVNNSYATGNVSGNDYVGGLVGSNYGGTVSKSYAAGDVSGDNEIGGLVGTNSQEITNSYATGNVTGNFSDIGGLVGQNSGTISHSYATGNADGGNRVGGLVGWSEGMIINSNASVNVRVLANLVGGLVGINEGKISHSYASGHVEGRGIESMNSWMSFGGLVGDNEGTISHSYATGNVNGRDWIGGLVGRNSQEISHSYATGYADGENKTGGLVGFNDGTISNSYATGNADGGNRVGGLVGQNDHKISNTYSTGNVDGYDEVGGLVGTNFYEISNSYAIGEVDGDYDVGGLVGDNHHMVENSFWDVETSGQNESDGGTGKTTAEMKDVATYTDLTNAGLDEPWDFIGDPNHDDGDEDIWNIEDEGVINDGYPFFIWWETLEYELDLNIEGEGTVTVKLDGEYHEVENEETFEIDEYTYLTLTADFEENWEFKEWAGDHPANESEENHILIVMDDDKSITAHFEEIVEYNLTVDSTENGEVVEPGEGGFVYEEGEVVDLEVEADENHHFVEWTGDNDTIADTESNETTIDMLDDYEITAEFAIDTYELIISSIEGGEVVEPGEETYEYEHGKIVILEVLADENYEFKEWTGDTETIGNTSAGTTTIEMFDDYTIVAEFEEDADDDAGDDEDSFFMNPMILGLLGLAIAVIAGVVFFAIRKKSSKTSPSSQSQQNDYSSENQEPNEEAEPSEDQQMEPDQNENMETNE